MRNLDAVFCEAAVSSRSVGAFEQVLDTRSNLNMLTVKSDSGWQRVLSVLSTIFGLSRRHEGREVDGTALVTTLSSHLAIATKEYSLHV